MNVRNAIRLCSALGQGYIMKDKRKSRRRTMRYSAWLVLEGDQLVGCAISDISETGARIDVEDADAVPDRVELLLSANGAARRKCQVIWRQPRQIGVRFAQHLAETEKAGLVPEADADTAAPAVVDITDPAKAD